MATSVWTDRGHPYNQAPRHLWLVTNTPTTPPYPCQCRHPQPCPTACPCWGRIDTHLMPDTCCATRATHRRRREAA